jgi:glycosyltransferase involved in cell wall biosynthesis
VVAEAVVVGVGRAGPSDANGGAGGAVVTLSVVIPAHDEGAVIERCLERLAGADVGEPMQVVVACNGCTDDTAERARGVAGRCDGEVRIEVVETATASKIAGLNLGDERAEHFPRLYVDADVVIEGEAIRAVAAALRRPGVLAAAPKMRVDAAGSSWPVRAWYAVWRHSPYHRTAMLGAGVYGVSEQGRSRWGAFPSIIADDEFVRSHFTEDERVNPAGATFVITAPRGVWGLVKVKSRSRLGLYELRSRFPELSTVSRRKSGSLSREIARRPWLWPAAGVYVLLGAVVRWRAAKQLRDLADYAWERDESSRVAPSRGLG